MTERENNELEIYATAEGLAKTFVNRQDCFAIQTESGQYYRVNDTLTANHIVRHLKGEVTFGTYLLDSEGKTKFAVIDADDDDLSHFLFGDEAVHSFVQLPTPPTEAAVCASGAENILAIVHVEDGITPAPFAVVRGRQVNADDAAPCEKT